MRFSQELLEGYIDLAEKERCNYFMTIAFNRSTTPYLAAQKLSQLHHKLDKILYGPNFYRLPLEQRTFFFACPEHLESNFHYHLIMRVAEARRSTFEEIISNLWDKICPGGSIKFSYIRDRENLKKVTGYSLKEASSQKNYEEIILSPTFISSSSACLASVKGERFVRL